MFLTILQNKKNTVSRRYSTSKIMEIKDFLSLFSQNPAYGTADNNKNCRYTAVIKHVMQFRVLFFNFPNFDNAHGFFLYLPDSVLFMAHNAHQYAVALSYRVALYLAHLPTVDKDAIHAHALYIVSVVYLDGNLLNDAHSAATAKIGQYRNN